MNLIHDKQTGFTLIELMITLVIATILITVGVPSFSGMIKNNTITTQANQFIAAMNFARSEAIKRGAVVNITATDASAGNNEWGKGWTITDNGGTTLRVFAALDSSSTLDSTGDDGAYQYLASGRIDNEDTLNLCDNRTGETGRQITITTTGRVSVDNVACP